MTLVANQVVEECESTNDLARALGEAGYPPGTWISARRQNRGRGRMGREWQSVEGNLFLSLLAKPEKKAAWTWVPMASAVGIAHAVRGLFPGVAIRVKWPNDLWVSGRKLGGVLCEAVGMQDKSFIVIGIGLNCAFAPQGLDQLTTSLSEQTGKTVVADQIRMAVIESVTAWTNADPEQIAEAYAGLAAFPEGTQIQWADGKETGAVIGLGPSGELKVKNVRGETASLYAEDVKIRPA